tara:strand:+ start:581 stop:1204 length:624 start_codon:yes stop_codon:yes gene_type:complete
MTLQSSGTISMNDINRELKSYTASGTAVNLNDSQFRKMGAGTGTTSSASSSISLGDFYGDRSHVRITTAAHTTSGSTTTIRNGYIKDFFSSGSHLGSLHSSAGLYIPSSGDTLNALNEREVIACYTMHMYNSYFNQKTFKLTLLGQITSSNTFTGIQERLLNNNQTGQYQKTLSSATFSSSGTASDTWSWSISTLWTGATTRYIHWY